MPVPVAFDLHHPMSLTERGDRIAIDRPFDVGNNNGGLSIFDWDQLGYSVAITPDGTRVIAGMPAWDDGNSCSDNRGGSRTQQKPTSRLSPDGDHAIPEIASAGLVRKLDDLLAVEAEVRLDSKDASVVDGWVR